MIWYIGSDRLCEFLEHPSNINLNVVFTMEVEKEGYIPFLDILISWNMDGTLGHGVESLHKLIFI